MIRGRLGATRLLPALLVLSAGAAGGAGVRLLGLPLPWTLGAMTAAALLSLAWPRLTLPAAFRGAARPMIGVMAGSAFSPAVVDGMATWWPMLLLLSAFFMVVLSAGMLYFRACGFDRATAFFASMPGGLGEMTLLGAQFGADLRRLVLVHSVRIIVVVTAIPFILTLALGHDLTPRSSLAHGAGPEAADWAILAACALGGYVLGRPLRSFGGGMILALLLSALAHGTGLTAAAPPVWLVAGLQVVIGCVTGARFAGTSLAEARAALWQGILWAAILIGMALVAASLSAQVLRQPWPALFLAMAPGGFAEMSIIALAAGIEVAFVVTCHAFRTICIVLVAPLLYQLSSRRSA